MLPPSPRLSPRRPRAARRPRRPAGASRTALTAKDNPFRPRSITGADAGILEGGTSWKRGLPARVRWRAAQRRRRQGCPRSRGARDRCPSLEYSRVSHWARPRVLVGGPVCDNGGTTDSRRAFRPVGVNRPIHRRRDSHAGHHHDVQGRHPPQPLPGTGAGHRRELRQPRRARVLRRAQVPPRHRELH